MKTKLTAAQRECLGEVAISSRSGHGFYSGVLSSLCKRGLLKADYYALTDCTYYEITEAGRAALMVTCPDCGDQSLTEHLGLPLLCDRCVRESERFQARLNPNEEAADCHLKRFGPLKEGE